MDIAILTSVLAALILLLVIYHFYKKSTKSGSGNDNEEIVNEEDDVDNDEETEVETPQKPTRILAVKKIGTKKLAKLEAKAEKKLQHERELHEREEQKKLKEKQEEEERVKLEKKHIEDSKRLEELQKRIEEKRKRDEEEYAKLKEHFTIEEEGANNIEDDINLFDRFIAYIKKEKIVILEELAVEFKLRTQDVINRIQTLQENNVLPGVIDDRGKFIYISDNEWQAVADFIRKRGRVSIADLTEYSSELIEIGDGSIT